jgi:2-succinyl-5-enolpyruvyl-6-hydroxy-3-cyclohexene-1-carboxylate synthase
VNPSQALATVLVDELIRGGVVDAVLSPGSRSAPLAYALYEANAAGRLRLHVRIDERTAGFLALGLAKASRRPVPVVCTSGTAAANLHPAVLEASHAAVPLMLLTADRPPELRGVGANQATDQIGLYGTAVRFFREVGVAEERTGQVAYWRALVSRAVAAATGSVSRDPGPVHLNVALREPLIPSSSSDWVEPLSGRGDGAPWATVAPLQLAAASLSAEPRTLVIVGDVTDSAVGSAAAALATRMRWPVIAEPSSGAWSADTISSLLLSDARWVTEHKPERILAVGHPTLSRAVLRLLGDPALVVDVVAETPRWVDPTLNARNVLPSSVLHAQLHGDDETWLLQWRRASDAVAAAVGPIVHESWPSGPALAAAVLATLPGESLLVLGSSNPIRDVDLYAAGRQDVRVLANRGLSGIDGTVSTAVGAALAADVPAYALLGDLTFLHDANGLILGADEAKPDLTIVVANDDGGGIFGLLEQGAPEYAEPFERLFGTSTGVDLAALCTATRTPCTRTCSRAELQAALAPRPGLRVVEVPIDRPGARELRARIQAAVANALSGDAGYAPPPQ